MGATIVSRDNGGSSLPSNLITLSPLNRRSMSHPLQQLPESPLFLDIPACLILLRMRLLHRGAGHQARVRVSSNGGRDYSTLGTKTPLRLNEEQWLSATLPPRAFSPLNSCKCSRFQIADKRDKNAPPHSAAALKPHLAVATATARPLR